jgi:DNA-binding MarR family transcriptional regulator
VNISSSPKQAKPIPDPREIIRNIRTLKREVTRIGDTNPGTETSHITRRLDALEQKIRRNMRQQSNLEQALMTATCTNLTEKQRTILRWLTAHGEEQAVYTALIQQLSQELDIPESTVRWNLKGLREAELINAGTKHNKGVPVSLTAMGRIMAGYATAPMD